MPSPRELPDHDELDRRLTYDHESGVLRWRERPEGPPQWNGKWAGKVAGGPSKSNAHHVVRFGNRLLLGHRIAWKLFSHEEPPEHIDHIDGDPMNNRIANLRAATRHENLRNAKRHKGKGLPK